MIPNAMPAFDFGLGETADALRENVQGTQRSTNAYNPTQEMEIPKWLVSINPSPLATPCITAIA